MAHQDETNYDHDRMPYPHNAILILLLSVRRQRRTVGDDHEPRQFSTWAPTAIAMIGRLPDTLNDRSVVINLRRRKPEERVKPFRGDRADDLRVIARKMARWAQDHTVALTAADPDMGQLMNRVADNWRPSVCRC